MKSLVIIFLLSFVWQSSDASETDPIEELVTCLMDNGFNSTSDVELIYAIGDAKQADKLQDVPKVKMAKVIACVLYKFYPEKNMYHSVRQLLDRDDLVTVGEIKQMEETSYNCFNKAAGNNAEFFNCLNIIEPPFDHLFATIRDIHHALQWCFSRCRITISEMYTMERYRGKSLKEYIQYFPVEKLGCFMACKAEEDAMNHPDRTLEKGLKQIINNNENIGEDEKQEMFKSLSNCSTQVSGNLDEIYDLIKCIDLFKPPFIDIF